METVTSADGSRIAFWREGSGPPLLLVHGGVCDHLAWYYVLPFLAKKFTVYTYDRRGRGESGDTPPYSVEREVEDLAAMLAAIGEPAHLLGHSAGAMLALMAAERCDDLLSLMLYEPAFLIEGVRKPPGPEVLEQMKSLLAAGERDEVIRMAIRQTVEFSEDQIGAMEVGPGWEQLRSVAHSIPQDWELWGQPFIAERVSAVRTRTLLLMGSESPLWLKAAARAVLATLPHATLEVLEGQGHHATITAPQMFAKAVLKFVEEG